MTSRPLIAILFGLSLALPGQVDAKCTKLPCALGPKPSNPPKPHGPTIIPAGADSSTKEQYRQAIESFRISAENDRRAGEINSSEYSQKLNQYREAIGKMKNSGR